MTAHVFAECHGVLLLTASKWIDGVLIYLKLTLSRDFIPPASREAPSEILLDVGGSRLSAVACSTATSSSKATSSKLPYSISLTVL